MDGRWFSFLIGWFLGEGGPSNQNRGGWKMIFLLNSVIFRFQMFILPGGVIVWPNYNISPTFPLWNKGISLPISATFWGKWPGRVRSRANLTRIVIYHWYNPIPIGSMYGIFTYIWLVFMVNVGKYTIHGCYGIKYHPNEQHIQGLSNPCVWDNRTFARA